MLGFTFRVSLSDGSGVAILLASWFSFCSVCGFTTSMCSCVNGIMCVLVVALSILKLVAADIRADDVN
jgi:hypothetical protein